MCILNHLKKKFSFKNEINNFSKQLINSQYVAEKLK